MNNPIFPFPFYFFVFLFPFSINFLFLFLFFPLPVPILVLLVSAILGFGLQGLLKRQDKRLKLIFTILAVFQSR